MLNVYSGIICKWLDGNGLEHRFKIPKSYYVQEGGCRLLSQQHWASTQHKATKQLERWYQTTYANKCVMHWGKYTLTVPISKQDNVGTSYSVSGYMKLKMSKKSDLVAKQILLSRSKDEGMYCEIIVNEVKLRKYWSTRSGLSMSKRQAVIEGTSEGKRLQEMTIDLNGVRPLST